MRRHVLLLSILAGALPACSLINSYDDVVTSQGSGGGSTTTTTGTGGTGSGTGGGTTTTTGTGGGGGGTTTVDCAVAGTPFTIEDLSSEVDPQERYYRDRAAGYQANGDQINVFLQRNSSLHAMQLNLTNQTIGQSFTTPAAEPSRGRRLPGGAFGILVVRPQMNGLYPIDYLTFTNNSLSNPGVSPISDGALTSTSTSDPRVTFNVRGPANDDLDVLYRVDEAGGQRVFFHKHVSGSVTTTKTEIVPQMAFVDSEDSAPRTIVRTADGKLHAFVGNPTMGGMGGTRQWTFSDGAAQATNPTGIAGNGYILLDAVHESATKNHIAYGHIDLGAGSLTLEVGQVSDAKLSNVSAADLDTIVTLNSLVDVPTSGEPSLDNDAVIMVGPNATKDHMVLILGKTGGGNALYKPQLFAPEAGSKFGDVAIFVTQFPITALGGTGYIVYTERHDPGPNQYDLLKVAQISCQKQ